MRRFAAYLAAIAALFALFVPVYAVSTHASSAILMDAESGRVLYEQNPHEKRLIASTTKLMTALVAVENCADLDGEVEIRPEWLGAEGSSIYLKAGEKITVRGLLYGLLLQSGNDSATAIACHIAGSEGDFVALMNQRAAELGMADTSFANACGLDHENHYSTAYDMALLARVCLKNETVAAICATKTVTIGTRTFVNHNKLLTRYEGCVGMKTGFTEKAGRTLVSAATRDGQTLICVTLNDGDDWNDHAKLLDYGFEMFPREKLYAAGDGFGAVPVSGSLLPVVNAVAASDVGYPIRDGEKLTLHVDLADRAEAPVHAGDKLGEAVWWLDGQPVARVDLVCGQTAGLDIFEPVSFWDRLRALFGAY